MHDTVNGNDMIEDTDPGQMAAELDGLQHRLDELARQGTNPYVIKGLQRDLDAARAELMDLFATQAV